MGKSDLRDLQKRLEVLESSGVYRIGSLADLLVWLERGAPEPATIDPKLVPLLQECSREENEEEQDP